MRLGERHSVRARAGPLAPYRLRMSEIALPYLDGPARPVALVADTAVQTQGVDDEDFTGAHRDHARREALSDRGVDQPHQAPVALQQPLHAEPVRAQGHLERGAV